MPADTISDTEKFNTLKTLAFFKDFREQELWETCASPAGASFWPTSRVIREGDSGDSFYIITGGEAKVSKIGPAAEHPARGRLLRRDALFQRDQHAALHHHHLAVAAHA